MTTWIELAKQIAEGGLTVEITREAKRLMRQHNWQEIRKVVKVMGAIGKAMENNNKEITSAWIDE